VRRPAWLGARRASRRGEERLLRRQLDKGWAVVAMGPPAPQAVLGRRFSAEVPGCVSTDLMAAGVLPDPYLGTNEELHAWVGRTRWRYETTLVAGPPEGGRPEAGRPGEGTELLALPLAPDEQVEVVFEGLDTVATIKLNETVIGTSANMHRSYRFNLSDGLHVGANVLSVEFEAPLEHAEAMSEQLGPRPHVQDHPFNAVRKMACNFGWDWGPDLPTVGIWRPARLERWRSARIESVRPVVRLLDDSGALESGRERGPAHGGAGLAAGEALGLLAGATEGLIPARTRPWRTDEPRWADASSPLRSPAVVDFHVDIARARGGGALKVGGGALKVKATVAGAAAEADLVVAEADLVGGEGKLGAGRSTAVVRVEVPEAELWWPAGYGAQPLYEAKVALYGANGAELDVRELRTGFRSVELDTRGDEQGCRLGLVVNGRAVQVRGANWIPDDCFPSRVTPERYRRRLEDARRANVNLLRVWGGGTYEDEEFYRAADELGLLVWQDFCFACAAYAEEEPLRSEVEAEAREAVTRLSAHPSLAVWCGCNENLWGYEDWGWKERLDGKTWGSGYYYGLLPTIVSELDPTRPYMAGTPWSLGYPAHPDDPRYGSAHVWDVWNQKDYRSYREWQPQFVTEFGFQGPPAWSTLLRALGESEMNLQSPALAAHEKAVDGLAKLNRWLAAHFEVPASFEDWHWATSLNQARAVSFAIEYWRSLERRCRGTVVWQLNDCWPVISWAAVDGDGRKKPLWYALRRAYADRLLTVQPSSEGSGLELVAVNDSLEPWYLDVDVTRQGFSGEVLAKSSVPLVAGPGERARVAVDPQVAAAGVPTREVLVASGGGHRALWWFSEDKHLELPGPALEARAERVRGGYEVALRAIGLTRDIALLADKVSAEAEPEDMLFTLLAGESRRLWVKCTQPVSPEALLSPTVLRSANQLVRAR